MKTFNKLPRLIQLILLLIPGVNYVVEIVVRVSAIFYKINLKTIIGLIFGIFIPIFNGLDWLYLGCFIQTFNFC